MVEPTLTAWDQERTARALAYGRRPGHDLHDLLYVDRPGIPWRFLPHNHPPWETVYAYFATWQLTHLFEQLAALRCRLVLICEERTAELTASILDSQSVKTSMNMTRPRPRMSTSGRRSSAGYATSRGQGDRLATADPCRHRAPDHRQEPGRLGLEDRHPPGAETPCRPSSGRAPGDRPHPGVEGAAARRAGRGQDRRGSVRRGARSAVLIDDAFEPVGQEIVRLYRLASSSGRNVGHRGVSGVWQHGEQLAHLGDVQHLQAEAHSARVVEFRFVVGVAVGEVEGPAG